MRTGTEWSETEPWRRTLLELPMLKFYSCSTKILNSMQELSEWTSFSLFLPASRNGHLSQCEASHFLELSQLIICNTSRLIPIDMMCIEPPKKLTPVERMQCEISPCISSRPFTPMHRGQTRTRWHTTVPVVWMWTLGHGAPWLQRHSFCTRHHQPYTRVNSFPAWPHWLFQLHISIWQPRPRTEWLRRQAYQECLFTPPPHHHRHRFFFFSKQAFRLLSILCSCPFTGTIPPVSCGHSFISRYTDSLSVSSCLKKSPYFSLNIDLII